MVDLVGSYQFDDQVTEGGDVFARDPYILRFRCLNTGECHEPWGCDSCAPSWSSCGDVSLFCPSAEGPGDDSSPHQTGRLGEGAG